MSWEKSIMDEPDNTTADAASRSFDDQKRIAELEQQTFELTAKHQAQEEELNEVKRQNELLRDNNNVLENAKFERNKYVSNLEQQREQLAKLQSENIELHNQKAQVDAELQAQFSEKRRLADELTTVRADLTRARTEAAKLQIEVDEFEGQKKLIEYEKERWSREKEILVQSKQWFMNEITTRDMKLNDLRLDMAAKEAQIQREKIAIVDENEELRTRCQELEEELKAKEEELGKMRDRLQE
ncbi:Viral A-type inclusion protein repeat containing protein, partial [Aphelenchoides avenae]